ncbi:uncharacterized protein KZ484_012097 isoform 2-T2 [Pholidichthys leucotaenia]
MKEEQEEPDPPQVKEEQEELRISQEGELLVVKLEADTVMVTISEENQRNEAEPNSEQLLSHNSAVTEIQDEEGSWRADSGSTKEEEGEPKPKKRRLKTRSNNDDDSLTSETLCDNETDASQLRDCKEEEVVHMVNQLWKQKRTSNLDQKEQDAVQVKEEEEGYFLKQETDTVMVTPADEDNDHNETEPNGEKLFFHDSLETESQDQGAGTTCENC